MDKPLNTPAVEGSKSKLHRASLAIQDVCLHHHIPSGSKTDPRHAQIGSQSMRELVTSCDTGTDGSGSNNSALASAMCADHLRSEECGK